MHRRRKRRTCSKQSFEASFLVFQSPRSHQYSGNLSREKKKKLIIIIFLFTQVQVGGEGQVVEVGVEAVVVVGAERPLVVELEVAVDDVVAQEVADGQVGLRHGVVDWVR